MIASIRVICKVNAGIALLVIVLWNKKWNDNNIVNISVQVYSTCCQSTSPSQGPGRNLKVRGQAMPMASEGGKWEKVRGQDVFPLCFAIAPSMGHAS